MKKVCMIAFLMALIAIPTLVSSGGYFDPRCSVQGNDRLIEAVNAGRLKRQCALHCSKDFRQKCKQCIKKGKDCIVLNTNDCKLCENKRACRAYSEGVIDLLDRLKADVNYPAGCWQGDTPLIEAVLTEKYPKKRKRIIEAIGNRAISIDGKSKMSEEKIADLFPDGGVVLTRIAEVVFFKKNEKKRVTVIKALLSRGANPNLTSCYFGVGPLMEAIKMRDVKVARLLIKAGANTDGNICHRYNGMEATCSRLNKTPLMESARRCDFKMVKLLIKFGANPLLYDKDGQTALRYVDIHLCEDVKTFLQNL